MSSARENTNGSRGTTGLPPVPSIPLTAETPSGVAGEASVGELVRDVTTHLSTLVSAQVELAKIEVTKEVKKGLTGSVFFLVALTTLLFSLFFFFIFLGFLFHDWFGWSFALSFGVVFGLQVVTFCAFGLLGWLKVRKIRAPQRTIDSAKDTVAALRHRGEDR